MCVLARSEPCCFAYLGHDPQTNPVVVVQALMHIQKTYGDGDVSGTVIRCLAKAIVTNNSLGPIVFITPELGKWSTVGGKCPSDFLHLLAFPTVVSHPSRRLGCHGG